MQAIIRTARVGWLVVVCGLASLPDGAAGERIWGELDRPYEKELVREPVGLVEVRGWAGTGLRGSHDVVIVIDRSGSTFASSGVDVDGDGKIGKNLGLSQGRLLISDPDDTIAQALLAAARRLIDRLDSDSTRMGIVTFARNERVLARVGAGPDQLRDVLDDLGSVPDRGGTYFYGAIMAAIKVLEQAPVDEGETRQRSIILLSDGLPNAPPPHSAAEKAAVRASQHAARASVRIYSFALGPEVASRPKVFLDMAEVNGGELLIVETPGEIVEFVPYMSLTRLDRVEQQAGPRGAPVSRRNLRWLRSTGAREQPAPRHDLRRGWHDLHPRPRGDLREDRR
jgi:Mg-chelatase subunit ChlD